MANQTLSTYSLVAKGSRARKSKTSLCVEQSVDSARARGYARETAQIFPEMNENRMQLHVSTRSLSPGVVYVLKHFILL